jgi:Pyruvate/2-oxoacid:ferredoxin oxidoreductase gamma subunit
MQLTGSQFTLATALARNDLATLPDFPAEIRAPAGTTYGVSGFQLHFGSGAIHTPGDEVDLLVAMNPAALKVNLGRVRRGGGVLVNLNAFERRDLELAGYTSNPLDDGSLQGFEVFPVELTRLTREALADAGLSTRDVDRCKNMFALGLSLWLYTRPVDPARAWIAAKFGGKPQLRDANLRMGIFGAALTITSLTNEDLATSEGPGHSAAYRGLRKDQAQSVYRLCQAQEQAWREKRRVRDLDELRAQSGGVNLGGALSGAAANLVAAGGDPTERLRQAKQMLDDGLITDAEYETIKARVVDGL